MKKFKTNMKNFIVKHGGIIAVCAMVFATFAANSTCGFPYYEEAEPKNLSKFKKFN